MRRFLGPGVVYTMDFLGNPLFSAAVKGRHPFRRPLWEILEIGVTGISLFLCLFLSFSFRRGIEHEFKNSLVRNS